MTDTTPETDEPLSRPAAKGTVTSANSNGTVSATGLISRVMQVLRGKTDTNLREALEEYIEEAENGLEDEISSISAHERVLIGNILKLRDMKVVDVMIPRADIVAVDINTSQKDLLSLLAEKQFSRIPVYREKLDEIAGSIHIKDILAGLAAGKKINIASLVRDVPIVSPFMHVLDLLLMMRQMRKHMVLVVDEFGGIDGLVTIGDVIEAIVGEIEDEYDVDDTPKVIERKDGTLLADARLNIEELETTYGLHLNGGDREDIDTIGGLIFSLAGRVPARGEIITHKPTGIVFEILDADPRRVNRVLIRNFSLPKEAASS